MWITKLQLSNIKSYGPDSPPIVFRPGVNLIQGKNGAGKSTILESIGLALFDSKTYNLGQFVREGARSGTVTVGFISAQDEREYEIVRNVGGSSQMYAYDPDTKRKICEGKEDTMAFIRQHLNVEPETDLKTIFEDAVGVPQGTMTAIFRESASVRKEKFNRLLGIDSYERVWHNLRQTGSYIKTLIDQNERQQAELHGILSEKATVEDDAATLASDMTEAQSQLVEVQRALDETQAELSQIASLKEQLDALNNQLRDSDSEVRQFTFRQEQAVSALQEAEQAAAILAETGSAEQAYRAAQEQLAGLEKARQERDVLMRNLNRLETERQVEAQRVQTLQINLREVQQAEAQLTALAPQVERQTALEEAVTQAQAADQRHHDLARQYDQQLEAVSELKTRYDRLLPDLPVMDAVAENPPPGAEDDGLDDAVIQLRDVVNDLERSLQGWQAALKRAQETASEKAALEEQIAERQRQSDQLSAVESALQTQTDQITELRLQIGSAEQELGQLAEHRALLGETGAVCPVCRQTVDAHAQDAAQSHYAAEQERLEAIVASAGDSLETANETLAQLSDERQAIAAQLASLPGESVMAGVVARLDAAEADALAQQTELQTLAQRAVVYLAVVERQIVVVEERLQLLAAQADGLAGLRAELVELDDPRRRYDLAATRAEKRSELEEQLEKANSIVENVVAQIDALQTELATFAELDHELVRLRTTIADNEQAHQRYLSHVELAGTLDTRQGMVDTITAQLTAQLDAQAQVMADRDALAEAYDADQHETLQKTLRSFEDERLTLETRLKEWQGQANTYQERLRDFEEKEKALAVAEGDARRLQERMAAFEFVRQTIRDAGPQITQQLVRLISEQANHIFGDILGDHSFILNWSEDYGITINSRGDERDFELLSGGEQMVAAMSVRLALLTQLATVRFAFFDEPTTNLDDSRRAQLAERLSEIHSLQQLFVISHDDTFEQESYHVIQVYKDNGFSQVEML